jgi:hypothetical protein
MRRCAHGCLAAFDMCQRHQQQFKVGVQQCLPVTAAFAFMRVAGGPHTAMHVSAVTFFHMGDSEPVSTLHYMTLKQL